MKARKAESKFRTKILFSCFLLVLSLAPPVFGESEFSLRLAPTVELPTMQDYFSMGIGAMAGLDWTFLTFFKKLDLGVSAGGKFLTIPVKVGEPMIFMEGRAGPILQYRPFDRWSFNAGFYGGIHQFSREGYSSTKALWALSFGADFYILPYFSVFAEAGYNSRVFSEGQPFSSLSAAVGISFNISELMGGKSRVQVEKTEQYRIFPVSWAWYEHNPVSKVKITNEERNTITDVTFSLFMESYMGQPYVFATVPRIAPGESADVNVTALFNDVMLGLTENTNANGVIQVSYRSLGAAKEASFPLQMPIFHRNTLSWDDDRRAAAFVSPRDSAARLFARNVANTMNIYMESGEASAKVSSTPKNVRYAAALFEALRLYGISYVLVPSMSFVNLHADESALDNLTYPYETLHYRGGDCTYISILFCSLLEALDVETAFITIPGHLFMAFEVGDKNWMAEDVNIIEIDGRRWMPVEITVPEEGFIRAWRIGAREWRSSGVDAAIFPIRDCWKVYPPVTVIASVDYPPEIPPPSDIISAVEAEFNR